MLLLALSDRYLPHVSKKERKVLKKIRSTLQKKRDRQFKQMKQFLRSESYRDIKKDIRRWCKQSHQHGQTQAIAAGAMASVATVGRDSSAICDSIHAIALAPDDNAALVRLIASHLPCK